MKEAVFISDLHLGPDTAAITEKFRRFSRWIIGRTKRLYILGDFFHAWPGDDLHEAWLQVVSDHLKYIASSNIKVFFMVGNRDFLLGQRFCEKNNMQLIKEPYFLDFTAQSTLLSHGDRYCTKDISHQWFRRFTRNAVFKSLFCALPIAMRKRIVSGVRQHSQSQKQAKRIVGDVCKEAVMHHLLQHKCTALIHGHTHKPALHKIISNHQLLTRYVLSDWDDKVIFLCYDKAKGYNFVHLKTLKR